MSRIYLAVKIHLQLAKPRSACSVLDLKHSKARHKKLLHICPHRCRCPIDWALTHILPHRSRSANRTQSAPCEQPARPDALLQRSRGAHGHRRMPTIAPIRALLPCTTTVGHMHLHSSSASHHVAASVVLWTLQRSSAAFRAASAWAWAWAWCCMAGWVRGCTAAVPCACSA